MGIDTLRSSLPPEPRAFPFRAPRARPGSHPSSLSVLLFSWKLPCARLSRCPGATVMFLATLASTKLGLVGKGRGHHSYEASVCGKQAPASQPCVLFVHLQVCLHLRNRNRDRHRRTFSSVVSGCIEIMCEVTAGCIGLSVYLFPPPLVPAPDSGAEHTLAGNAACGGKSLALVPVCLIYYL